jgi:protocatechuate 3,4-dioxygenase beta subunit
MSNQRPSRRDSLLRCAALGSLRLAGSLSLTEALSVLLAQEEPLARKPTPWNEIGPFYKRLAPSDRKLRHPSDPGLPLAVTGRIFNTRGETLAGAQVEVWHADHFGHYDLDGNRYRARLVADPAGKYSFDSIMPGHYPDRICQHIHYLVTAAGHKPLVTQLYFATDPAFEGDPDHNYARDPLVLSRELVRPVMLTGEPKAMQAQVTFELVVDRL